MAKPHTFTLAGAKTANAAACGTGTGKTPCNDANKYPGNTMSIDWTMSAFTGFVTNEAIWAPYDIEITFKAIAAGTVTKHVYENWSWVATCTNL